MSEELKLQTLVNALDMYVSAINSTLSEIGTFQDIEVEIGTTDVTTFGHESHSVVGITYKVNRFTRIYASGDKS